MTRVIILTPVYNDWECLGELTVAVKKAAQASDFELKRIVVINDNSSIDADERINSLNAPIDIINLSINLGHQRAIATGLAYIAKNFQDFDVLVVMDSDGEDNPSYIHQLSTTALKENRLVFAQRKYRSEGLLFKLFYNIYKLTFRILTNQKISFGNFSCIPSAQLSKIVRIPELWNHYSGCIIKSKIPYSVIPTERSKRYFGESKMNFQNLVVHGLSAISIYLDVVISKIFLVAFFGILAITGGILTLLYLKFFTTLAIPGWTSNVLLALLNIGGLLFIITLLLLLVQLNNRSMQIRSVSSFYEDYISSVKKIN
jgi:hypothetical protein